MDESHRTRRPNGPKRPRGPLHRGWARAPTQSGDAARTDALGFSSNHGVPAACWLAPFMAPLLSNLFCRAWRSASDFSVSHTEWIMVLPVDVSLWQTSLVLGVSSVFELATTVGAVALTKPSFDAQPTR